MADRDKEVSMSDSEYFFRLCRLVVGDITNAIRKFYEQIYHDDAKQCWDSTNGPHYVRQKCSQVFQKKHLLLNKEQVPKFNQGDVKDWDISLCCVILQDPYWSLDRAQLDAVKDLKHIRNVSYGHASRTKLTKDELHTIVDKAIRACNDLFKKTNVSKEDIDHIIDGMRKTEQDKITLEEILHHKNIQHEQQLAQMLQSLQGIHAKYNEQSEILRTHEEDISMLKSASADNVNQIVELISQQEQLTSQQDNLTSQHEEFAERISALEISSQSTPELSRTPANKRSHHRKQMASLKESLLSDSDDDTSGFEDISTSVPTDSDVDGHAYFNVKTDVMHTPDPEMDDMHSFSDPLQEIRRNEEMVNMKPIDCSDEQKAKPNVKGIPEDSPELSNFVHAQMHTAKLFRERDERVRELEEEVESLKQKVISLEKEKISLQELLEVCSDDRHQLEKTIEEKDDEIKELEDTIEQRSESLRSLLSALKKANSISSTLEKENEKLMRNNRELNRSTVMLQEENKELKRNNKDLSRNAAELQSILLDMEDYCKITDGIFINETKDSILGQGAYGTVYSGLYRGEHCAVKILNIFARHIAFKMNSKSVDKQAWEHQLRSFKTECECLQSLHHENVVRLLEVCEVNDYPVIVMEKLDCTLRQYYESDDYGQSSFKESIQLHLSLSSNVTSGLKHLHDKRIIHRDLCGNNVLLKLQMPYPVAKISDFGTSKIVDEDAQTRSFTQIFPTRVGYFPPELWKCPKSYSFNIDIFMLGVVMLQITHSVHCVQNVEHRSQLVQEISSNHPLKALICMCLSEVTTRPTAEIVVKEIRSITNRD